MKTVKNKQYSKVNYTVKVIRKHFFINCAIIFLFVMVLFTWSPEKMQKILLKEVDVTFLEFARLEDGGRYFEHVVKKDALVRKKTGKDVQLYIISLRQEGLDYKNIYSISYVEVTVVEELNGYVAIDGELEDVFLIIANPTPKMKEGELVLKKET